MKSSKWIGWYTLLFLLGTIYPVTGFASTPQAEITHLVIKNTEDALLVDLKKGVHYQLMVGAVLSIKKFLLFNLYREFESDRYTVNFIY